MATKPESVKPVTETKKPVHPRKLELVHAAVTCFLERGYHQTGVRDIATQAGVSLGNLYNHFNGKEAVLAFIADMEGEELAGFADLLTAPANPQDALGRFIDAYAAYVSRPENALLGVEILTESLRNPAIAEVFGRNRSRLIDTLASCLRDGAKSGAFASFGDMHEVACIILDTLEGHGLRQLSNREGGEISKQTLTRFLINGLRGR